MSKLPLYEVIFRHFKEKIISGQLTPGNQLPTEKEIAKEFKVSRITAIRALNELELKGFIRRIQGSGSYVSKTYLNKDSGSTGPSLISLVLPYDENFRPEFLKGIEEVARKHNYFVTFHNSTEDPEIEKNVISEIILQGSKGIILYPTESTKNMELYSNLIIKKFPLVLIDRKISGLDLSIIWTDNQQSFYDITSHLLKLGHKKIIFVGTSVYTISSELERYKGFCKAHIDHEVPLLEKHLYSQLDTEKLPSSYKSDLNFEQRAIHYLFDLLENLEPSSRPTAIASVNDFIAEVIISVGLERKISIPSDYSITGFDDRLFAAHLPIPLTTIAQPVYEIGKMAAVELFDKIKSSKKNPANLTLKGKLIIRKSTDKPRSN